ncbi:hypothetical protein MtrunA17_Chr2g0307931 [Medicago truncatula]|uniref:Magnesium transporter MRS2-I, putative n=1 Tax=Medicago truncatula TaxID=3880 RepID=G7IT05_MEDTR|nr:magnesium transporter MRS2-I, putative [Medicago truncatula]RHN74224.1 hypothetical protein MtrunA17_Chr2g0307931 [Medicago truncatula]
MTEGGPALLSCLHPLRDGPDSNGHSSQIDVDKYAIMHRVQINACDLRILDPLLSYPSVILGREKAIILNLEHIKMIITADEVSYLFFQCVNMLIDDGE